MCLQGSLWWKEIQLWSNKFYKAGRYAGLYSFVKQIGMIQKEAC